MSQLAKESNEKETFYFGSSFGGDVFAFQLPQKKTLKKKPQKVRVPTTKVGDIFFHLHLQGTPASGLAFLRSKINCAKSSIL